MTPEKLQKFRDWAAQKCELVIRPYDHTLLSPCYYTKKGEFVCFMSAWQPDRPESGQIWVLVERMRELGWYLSLDQSMVTPFEWTAQFFSEVHNHPVGLGTIDNDNPCRAIIKAARVTED